MIAIIMLMIRNRKRLAAGKALRGKMSVWAFIRLLKIAKTINDQTKNPIYQSIYLSIHLSIHPETVVF
uniref:Uncharacterized protein n=1 Tax=Rhizophora mucronata TaxID=61149 RepID=A0A2P2KPZ4_RHIMU